MSSFKIIDRYNDLPRMWPLEPNHNTDNVVYDVAGVVAYKYPIERCGLNLTYKARKALAVHTYYLDVFTIKDSYEPILEATNHLVYHTAYNFLYGEEVEEQVWF